MNMKPLDSIIRNSKMNVAIEHGDAIGMSVFTKLFSSNVQSKISGRLDVLFSSNKNVHAFKMSGTFDKAVLEWADRSNYLDLSEITVYSPVGLKVSYMEYIAALEKALSYLVKLDDELLIPTSKTLGSCINNPSVMMAKSGISFKGDLVGVDVEIATKPIADCFNGKEKSDTIRYKQAFRRNADINDAGLRLQQLQENIARFEPATIEKRARSIFDMAQALSADFEASDNFSEMGMTDQSVKRVTTELSDVLYNCAKWVEFYAIFQQQVIILDKAFLDTNDKLRKLAK